MHSITSTPYAIINITVPRGHAASKREAQRTNDAMAGPLSGYLKYDHQKGTPKMGITTEMIHCMTIDLKCYGVNLSPYKDFYLKEILDTF